MHANTHKTRVTRKYVEHIHPKQTATTKSTPTRNLLNPGKVLDRDLHRRGREHVGAHGLHLHNGRIGRNQILKRVWKVEKVDR